MLFRSLHGHHEIIDLDRHFRWDPTRAGQVGFRPVEGCPVKGTTGAAAQTWIIFHKFHQIDDTVKSQMSALPLSRGPWGVRHLRLRTRNVERLVLELFVARHFLKIKQWVKMLIVSSNPLWGYPSGAGF